MFGWLANPLFIHFIVIFLCSFILTLTFLEKAIETPSELEVLYQIYLQQMNESELNTPCDSTTTLVSYCLQFLFFNKNVIHAKRDFFINHRSVCRKYKQIWPAFTKVMQFFLSICWHFYPDALLWQSILNTDVHWFLFVYFRELLEERKT